MDTNQPLSQQPSETPSISVSAQTHEVSPPAASSVAPSSKKKSPLMIGIVAIAVIVLGIGGYFIIDMLNTPAKVKGKAEVVQPAFSDYSKAMTKISDYLTDEDGKSDSDSIERSVTKGKSLVKESLRTKKTLSALITDMNMAQTKNYKSAIDMYIKKAEEIEKNANENIILGDAYVTPLRKIEKMSVDISGASNYMYSEPKKYTTVLSDAIKQMDSIEKELQKVKSSGDLQESHELFISSLNSQKVFLESILQAVEERDDSGIATATKKYAQDSQQLRKDIARVSDTLKESTQEQADELQDIQEKVSDAYADLKSQYKF